jgi:hypothetical protein
VCEKVERRKGRGDERFEKGEKSEKWMPLGSERPLSFH